MMNNSVRESYVHTSRRSWKTASHLAEPGLVPTMLPASEQGDRKDIEKGREIRGLKREKRKNNKK